MTELMTAIDEIVRAAGAMARQAFTAPDKPAYSMKGRQARRWRNGAPGIHCA